MSRQCATKAYVCGFINAWAARVTKVAASVSVRVSVKSHPTSGVSVHRENAATYSVGNEGQQFYGVFSETAPLQRSSVPSLEWPYIWWAIFPADNALCIRRFMM